MSTWWRPWDWASASHGAALVNARSASTELSRRRVEREDVEGFLADRRSEEVRRAGAG